MKKYYKNYVRKYSDKECIYDKGKAYTGKELEKMYLTLQSHLVDFKDFTIGIVLENSIDFINAFYSIIECEYNLNAFPLYYRMTDSEIRDILLEIKSPICISKKDRLNLFSDFILIEDSDLVIVFDSKSLNKNNVIDYYQNSVFFLTSGTSGIKQKVVVHKLSNLYLNAEYTNNVIGLSSKEVGLIVLTMNFIYAISTQILTYIKLEMKFFILPTLVLPRVLENILSKFPITVLTVTPNLLKIIANFDLNSCELKYIIFGGEKAQETIKNKIINQNSKIKLIQSYGQTEFGSRITIKHMSTDISCDNVGKIVSDKIKIQIDPIEKNENYGRIKVSSPTKMIGYYPNKLNCDFLETGDLGFIDSKGDLHLIGRESCWIKSKEIRFNPIYLEESLNKQLPSCQFLMKQIDEDIILFVETNESSSNFSDICNRIILHIKKFSYYMHPREIRLVRELPRTSTNKLKRGGLIEENKVIYRKRIGGL